VNVERNPGLHVASGATALGRPGCFGKEQKAPL